MDLKKYYVYIFKLIWRKFHPDGVHAPARCRGNVGLQVCPGGVAGRTMRAGFTQRSKSAALT